tara:strand:+ start:180 stop:299 length:120 start_codon:yes stop_codon:yes gene_type:complete
MIQSSLKVEVLAVSDPAGPDPFAGVTLLRQFSELPEQGH